MKKTKNTISIILVALLFFAMTIACWFLPDKQYSDSERRKLASFPTLTIKTLLNGTFTGNFETYAQDQFPLRETFREIKAFSVYNVFLQKENNGIYVVDGYVAKLEYPLNMQSILHVTERFSYIYESYMKDKNVNVFVSVVPDKNYYLAKENGYPSLDYDALFAAVKENMTYAEYIDLTLSLDVSSYYRTDTHWRQEKIEAAARKLASAMGVELSGEYEIKELENLFYGVYYGQSALRLDGEKLLYIENDAIKNASVTNFESNKTGSVYDMEKADGKDPYEMFLSGSVSLITIENENASTDKELVVFRDSFGSSVAPYFIDCYKKITLVDVRYLKPSLLDKFIEFENQDVLFLYSTLVLNNSETIK